MRDPRRTRRRLLLLALRDLDELVGALEFEVATHHRIDDRQSGRLCIEGSCVGVTTGLAQQRRLPTPEIQFPGKTQLLRASPNLRACIRVRNDVLAAESPATLSRVIRQVRQQRRMDRIDRGLCQAQPGQSLFECGIFAPLDDGYRYCRAARV
jgi:hypothetical protein